MQLGLRIEQKQTLKLKPTLQQLQYYRLLQQTNLELEEDIREELSQNPALEVEEVRRCPRCGEILFEGQPCVTCITAKVEDDDREGISSEKLDMLEEIYSSTPGTYEASTYESIPEDDLPDTFATVVRPITLEDHLKRRLPIDCSDLSDEEMFLAVDLVDHIDTINDYSTGGEEEFEHIAKQHIKIDNPGLIRMTDDELAEELGARVETIKKVRRRVAEMDPVGSGLESVIDVLALQAELAEELIEDERTALAEILKNFLPDITKERYARVGKAIGLPANKVKELIEYAKHNFHLHPRREFEVSESNAAVDVPYISADVRIRDIGGKFIVEILDSGLPQLKVNKFYLDSYRRLKNDRHAYNSEERKHIKEYFERASSYLENLNSRRQTMLEITEEIVKRQEEYLRHGPLFLKKLTRKQIAETIGVHPSTVSRALAVRYCWLPDNSIVPFSVFFNPSLCYIEMIRQVIKDETKDRIFSDEEIRDIMNEKGHNLSRRVITKYRKKGRIPPSGRRRRFLVSEWKKEQAGLISPEDELIEIVDEFEDEEDFEDIDETTDEGEDAEIEVDDELTDIDDSIEEPQNLAT